MRRAYFAGVAALLLAVCLVAAEPALAGPGGKIASALFDSIWGKVLLVIVIIVFLPFIVYVVAREKLAERRTLRDLQFMAEHGALFDWLRVRERILDCFHRVHAAWRKEDASEAAQWMTDWYWQNQQLVYLDQWAREGLVNHCNVKRVTGVRPLLFAHRNDGPAHEGSTLVAAISAYMQDYLVKRDTDAVIEGSKKFKDVETVWTFTVVDGRWRVSNIEEGALSLTYARLTSDLPAIESTLVRESES